MTMTRWIQIVAIFGFLTGSNLVHAQDAQLSGQVELAKKSDPKEVAQYVRTALEEMMSGLKSVSKLVDGARRDGDQEMLSCLQSRLSYIRALLMVSERANGAMKEAQAKGNGARAEHEFRKIVVSLAKVRQFIAEAETCMGEAGTTPGTSELQVAESGLAEADDTEPLDDYLILVGIDPPNTSPFE